jgi:hypothetical protein
MPYTVGVSFAQFFNQINLSGDFRDIANTRREWLVRQLSSKLKILDSFATGSIPKFTAVAGHADVDVMVVLHYGNHIEGRKPSQVLANVRSALSAYSTRVRRNGQAVTLKFQSWPAVDIVPVSRFVREDKTISHFNVPDMHREEWLVSRPNAHTRNVSERVTSYGAEFRHIIKMMKWWNYERFGELQSYHIEVMALQTLKGKFGDYPWEVFQLFEGAHQLAQGSLWHEDGFVDSYLNYDSRRRVVAALSEASILARSAWHNTYGGRSDHQQAIGLWRKLFGDAFPKYG